MRKKIEVPIEPHFAGGYRIEYDGRVKCINVRQIRPLKVGSVRDMINFLNVINYIL